MIQLALTFGLDTTCFCDSLKVQRSCLKGDLALFGNLVIH